MRAVKVAVDVLDHLDPILGYDLLNILEEPGDDPKKALEEVCTTCRCRQAIHLNNSLGDLWQCAIDSLLIAIKAVPAC
jgi:hypothetical protein